MDDESTPRDRLIPVYAPHDPEAKVVLYSGELDVLVDGQRHRLDGRVQLQLYPTSALCAQFAGPSAQYSVLFGADDPIVSVPAGSSLRPPRQTHEPSRTGNWFEGRIRLSQVCPGDLSTASTLMIHVSQAVQAPRFRRLSRMADGTRQGQIEAELDGWHLVFAPRADPIGPNDFGAVIAATPPALPMTRRADDRSRAPATRRSAPPTRRCSPTAAAQHPLCWAIRR